MNEFSRAVAFAADAHDGQVRKGTSIPYITHPVAVAALVAADGGSEVEQIVAVLHDVIEDTHVTYGSLVWEFGVEVADLVALCSDTDQRPKPPWKPRKEAFLARLSDPNMPLAVLRVVAADKLHNARCTLADLGAHGPEVWDRFRAPVEEQLWYYTETALRIADRLHSPLAVELVAAVDQLRQRAKAVAA